MMETKPDYEAMARERIAELEPKRGLPAAELEAIEAELRGMRGDVPGQAHAARHRRGALAFAAVLGDEAAAAELEGMERREAYLERRAALCVEVLAHVDARIEGQRRTWLQGAHAASLPLDEIPEVLRERVREALEVLHAGAVEMNGSTRYDVDGHLRWDAKREVWVGSDGFAFDGAGLRDYSRGGAAPGGGA